MKTIRTEQNDRERKLFIRTITCIIQCMAYILPKNDLQLIYDRIESETKFHYVTCIGMVNNTGNYVLQLRLRWYLFFSGFRNFGND